MSKHRRLLVLYAAIALQLLSLPLRAQTTDTKASLLGIGSANVLDTYLSPEQYSGTAVSLLSVNAREKDDSPWTRQTLWGLHVTTSSNRANNGDYLGGRVDFQHDWLLPLPVSEARLTIGPSAAAAIGGLYNTRNGNNPAQLQAGADIGISACAGKTICVFHKDFTVNYQATLPLLGAAFTPQYGQSYYEIFTQANYDHNVVMTTPFNALSLRHMLTVDFTIRRHTFRIGYRGDYRQREANNLKFHDYAHMLVIGYIVKR